MALSISVPNLGPEMGGGIVAEWYRPDGSSVDAGELICRLECEFVAFEIEAEAHGQLHHRRPAGSVERPGAVIGLLLAPGEGLPDEAELTGDAQPPFKPDDQPDSAALADEFEDYPLADTAPPPLAPGEPIVVPFRRRPGDTQPTWAAVPGPVAGSDTSLSDTAEPLAEAGAAIPGLPLWEPDEDPPYAEAFPNTGELAGARFAAIAAEDAGTARVLTMEVLVNSTEAVRATRVLAREWREFTPPPIVEDLALRAFAKALAESGYEASPAGLVLVTAASDETVAVSDVAARDFRDAVRARATGGDEAVEHAAWTLTSLRALGMRAAQPALVEGQVISVAVGGIDEAGMLVVTMSYHSAVLGPGEAARLLSRVRLLVEEPYGLLST